MSDWYQPAIPIPPIQIHDMVSFLAALRARFASIDQVMTRRENILSFLVVRFVLMSGMVVGFSWWALKLTP